MFLHFKGFLSLFAKAKEANYKTFHQKVSQISNIQTFLSSNVSTTPLQQCLPFSWTTLRGKHCRYPIAAMGVVDTFGLSEFEWIYFRQILGTWIHCGSLPKVKCVPIGGHSSLNFPSALPNVCTQLLPVVKKGFSFWLGVELVKKWVVKSRPTTITGIECMRMVSAFALACRGLQSIIITSYERT